MQQDNRAQEARRGLKIGGRQGQNGIPLGKPFGAGPQLSRAEPGDLLTLPTSQLFRRDDSKSRTPGPHLPPHRLTGSRRSRFSDGTNVSRDRLMPAKAVAVPVTAGRSRCHVSSMLRCTRFETLVTSGIGMPQSQLGGN